MPVNLYQAVWIFLIYAFIGWCCEVAFAAVELGKFINRGFLNGPVCPIYGVGMLVVLIFLWPLKSNLIILFLGAAVLTSVLEFVTGYVLEKFFHDKWWDYSNMPFNLKGYICLKFSIMWGLAAAFIVGAVHPFLYFLITKLPIILGIILMITFLSVLLIDFIITITEIMKLPKKLNTLLELEKILRTISDSIGENISETTLAAKEKGSGLLEENKPRIEELRADYEKKKAEFHKLAENRNAVHIRIIRAFPNLRNGKYKAVFDRISSIRVSKSEKNKFER